MKRIIRIVIIFSFLLTSLGVIPALADPTVEPPIFLPLMFRSPNTYTVSGMVKDSGNFPIAGVVVKDARGETATTDLNGAYTLQVQPGPNTLTATRSGYDIAPITLNVTTSLAGVNFSAQVGCGNIVVNEQVTTGMGGWDFLTDKPDDVVPGTATALTDPDIFPLSDPSSGRVGIHPNVDNNVASTTRARSQLYHIPAESDADAVFLGVSVWLIDTGAGEFDRQYIDLVDEDGNVTNLYTASLNTGGWTYLEFPLDSFLGETVRIQFRVLNDGGAFYSTMYFDDVQLVICNTHCDNQIVNGGFETLPAPGDPVNTGWLYNAEAIINPWYTTDQAHTGAYSMQTGIPVSGTLSVLTGLTYFNLKSSSEVWQRNIDLPSDQSGGLLTFWIYRTSVEGVPPPIPAPPAALGPTKNVAPFASPVLHGPLAPTATPPEDWVYVYIYEDDGDFLAKPLWQRATNDATWIRYSVDLSDYMGQQIEVLFGTYNDGLGGPSAMYIDDVVVGTCD